MRRFGRMLKHALIWPLLAVLLYLAAAALGGLIPGRVAEVAPGEGTPVEIGLIAGPIHYDFILPATPETRAALAFAAEGGVPIYAPGVAHVLVGWGSAGFYTTAGSYADVAASTVLRAAIGDTSVLRFEVYGPLPAALDYPRLSLSPGQYRALLAFIVASRSGPAVEGAGFSDTDAFFAARGRFHLLRTCNTWITDALRAAGHPAGAWTPTPYAVTLSLWWHG
ncbi:TIGR02117 family protein [Vannielia litorea]|uniref:TIGR02117 family protein n=1 Tax=Vannielia litorea TaxID=1217970 RepID=UPI001C93D8F9|nr:TIGR02117 family protein [Vannielia litorea]MBY6154033.1 TIGR02117 family protein [Vannielia litorea]